MQSPKTRWYQNAVIYQSHVKTFFDSSGDGTGDLRGFTEKLDYVQRLGVTAIWLLPFYPSPLRDDGYDIADYTAINPRYGTLADFKVFLREAHDRGLRVITELVLNHTSDKHPWFERSRTAKPRSRWREFYVWSDSPERYQDARIIFQDFEGSNWTWDPVAKAYYWHRFYHHQPDLNYENPEVRKTMLKLVEHWLEMGVDGLRLDAVPYLFERDGTNCENLPETHEYLKQVRATIDGRFDDRMLLAEANQWPEDAVAYFGAGDECHAAFHFPVMPRLFMAVQMEDRFPVIDILENTPPIPESCQWFLFLRNHDELTLEMVTDEERDYMVRIYARDRQARINLGIRRRLAPLLANDRRKIELLNGILLALPGTPVIYYGDEIGMGDNIYLGDRDGVRTPMQWSADRNAGFSTADPQRLYLPVVIDQQYHYQAVNVETQHNNPHSLLWWMRRLIACRQELGVFGRGDLKFLFPDNPKVLAFTRSDQGRTVLVVANLSRHAQFCELDLRAMRDHTPLEIFGNTPFPTIGESPYVLTIGPHAFYWFILQPARVPNAASDGAAPAVESSRELPLLRVRGVWQAVFARPRKLTLEELLPEFLSQRRWMQPGGREIQSAAILDAIPLDDLPAKPAAALVLLKLEFSEGEPEMRALVLGFCTASDDAAAAVCRLRVGSGKEEQQGVLVEMIGETNVGQALFEIVSGRRKVRGASGRLVGQPLRHFRRAQANGNHSGAADSGKLPMDGEPAVNAVGVLRTNNSFLLGERAILKFFRRIEEGVNPDQELSEYLTDTVPFASTPPALGSIVYENGGETPWTVAVLREFVRNEGDAWSFTVDVVVRFAERVLSEFSQTAPPADPLASQTLVSLIAEEPPALAEDLCGPYLAAAELIGRRTAELHRALSVRTGDPRFAPEPYTQLYQRSLFQALRSRAVKCFRLLRRQLAHLPTPAQELAESILPRQEELVDRYQALLRGRLNVSRIRCHGDLTLKQLLYTGKDFLIFDFEGDITRPFGERRIKRSALRDVASIVESLGEAARVGIARPAGVQVGAESNPLPAWAAFWSAWTSAALVKSYLIVAGTSSFIPSRDEDTAMLFDLLQCERAVDVLTQSLAQQPDRVPAALEGLARVLRDK